MAPSCAAVQGCGWRSGQRRHKGRAAAQRSSQPERINQDPVESRRLAQHRVQSWAGRRGAGGGFASADRFVVHGWCDILPVVHALAPEIGRAATASTRKLRNREGQLEDNVKRKRTTKLRLPCCATAQRWCQKPVRLPETGNLAWRLPSAKQKRQAGKQPAGQASRDSSRNPTVATGRGTRRPIGTACLSDFACVFFFKRGDSTAGSAA